MRRVFGGAQGHRFGDRFLLGRVGLLGKGIAQLLDLQPGEVEAVKRRVLIEQLGPGATSELGIAEFDDDSAETKRKPKAAW